jgi:hypothetical protein
MPRVIHLTGLCAAPRVWRNLAEKPCQNINIRAQAARRCPSGFRLVRRVGRSAVQVTPMQGIARSFGSAADAPDRCEHHERQAASGWIGCQRHPCRQGQGDRRTHCQDTDRCGQEDEPCKHFAQPPRENFGQIARHAWQEYGRVLVKVRRAIETFQPVSRLMKGKFAVVSACGGDPLRLQPKVEVRGWASGCIPKRLKVNNYPTELRGRARRLLHLRPSEAARFRCNAAIWRNPEAPNWAIVPELDKECLSFVMPQKQGGAAAGQGDTR